jgi:phosphatidylglycerophosphatase A
VGYLPGAPGTYASALGCALIYFFPSIFSNIFFCAGLVLFSTLCVNFFRYDGEDPGYIVIDELAGICVTMAGHRITLMKTIIGFALFRIFDIAKPFPIKHAERLKGGYGIVADDVIAGIFASAILIIFGRFL